MVMVGGNSSCSNFHLPTFELLSKLVELVRDHYSVCKPKFTKMGGNCYFSKFLLIGVKKTLQ